MTDKPDYKKDKKSNVKYEGYGQMGIIMLDIQWNAMEEGNGLAELAKPMYGNKMRDNGITTRNFWRVVNLNSNLFVHIEQTSLKLYNYLHDNN